MHEMGPIKKIASEIITLKGMVRKIDPNPKYVMTAYTFIRNG